jgi:hypothetical protein
MPGYLNRCQSSMRNGFERSSSRGEVAVCLLPRLGVPALMELLKAHLAVGVRSSEGYSVCSSPMLLFGQQAGCAFFRRAPGRSALDGT